MNQELDEALGERDFVYLPIRASSGTILHIGAGIYSSLAGALKELVSNSFDADATRVVISTGYPHVERIEVVDNGMGMTPQDLATAMLYIGTSLKRTIHEERHTESGRPVIGMLGIGLMALTQVCSKAIIESTTYGAEHKFRAELDFTEFRGQVSLQREAAKLEILRQPPTTAAEDLEHRIRQAISERASKELKKRDLEDTEGELLGYFMMYPSLPADPEEHGTRITLEDLDQAAIGLLLDRGRGEEHLPSDIRKSGMSWTKYGLRLASDPWEEVCSQLRTGDLPYHSLPRYQQFLWELGAMAPVAYLDEGPVTDQPDVMSKQKAGLAKYDFSVIVDNTDLRKPALLPAGEIAKIATPRSELDYYVEIVSEKETLDGDPLAFEGYILWQRAQVQPSALRGLQIYIRNVGIGPYDKTLLDWSIINPGSRAPQMSGEIYVDQGLERALNIDRNSFRHTDPHYVALQDKVFEVLGRKGEGIVGRSIDSYWSRRKLREKTLASKHRKEVSGLVSTASSGQIESGFSDRESDEPYEFRDRKVTIFDKSRRWPRSRKERHASQRVLVAVESAIAAGAGVDEIRQLLQELLLRPKR